MGTRRLFGSSFVISLGSFMFGYCMSLLNVPIGNKDAIGAIVKDITDLDELFKQLATAMVIAGAMIGSFGNSALVDKLGLRPVLIVNNIFFVVGALLCFFPNRYMLVGGRFLSGIGVGVTSTVCPVLLSEIAPVKLRGTITTLHQLMITIGILSANLVGYGFCLHVEHGWRYLVATSAAPAILQVLLFSLVPESPAWLARHKHVDARARATKTLRSLRDENAPGAELALQAEVDLLFAAASTSHSQPTWGQVLRYGAPVMFGIFLMCVQPLSGINAIIFYSTTIFEFAGVDDPVMGTLLVSATSVLMTLVSTVISDKFGRKTLLIAGTVMQLVALVTQSVALLALNDHVTLQGYIAVAGCLLYIIGFATGLGGVIWVALSELVPSQIRSKAFSIFILENWVWNLLIALFTLSAINGIGGGDSKEQQKQGVAYLFIIFAGVCLVALIFIVVCLPETRGLSPTEHARMFSKQGASAEPYLNDDYSDALRSRPGSGSRSAGGVEEGGAGPPPPGGGVEQDPRLAHAALCVAAGGEIVPLSSVCAAVTAYGDVDPDLLPTV